MNLLPKISLITVAYNSGSTIESTIRSVITQNYPNIEYVVVDGLSTDNTLEIVKDYSAFIAKIVSEKDEGIYDAMNKGVALATGDIIGLINSDDVLADENVLATVAELFSSNTALDACYGDLCYVKQDDLTTVVRYWSSSPFKRGDFRKGWVPPHPTLYVRRKVYEEFGSFNLTYRISADFELMLRFFEIHQIKAEYIPRVLVKMRLGGTTNRSFGNIIAQNLEIRRALRAQGISSPLAAFIFYKVQSRFFQFIRRPE